MRYRSLYLRLFAAALGGGALFFLPVVTPVWAAPRPVPPKLSTTPVAGVDERALESSPAAYDSRAVREDRNPAASSRPRKDLPRASKASRPAVLTQELPREKFAVAGMSWTARPGASEPVVQVRLREDGGWTEWEPLDAVHGPDADGPDAQKAAGRVASEPIFSSSADAVQVRVDTADGSAPEGLAVTTVDPGTSAADGNLTGTPGASARAGVNRPGIYTRAQWGADESLRDCSPTYSPTVKVGFVHHTVGSNTYSPSQSAAIVRGIYAFHANGNGWCDIGYSFLVDRFGQIFEGRAGGIDRPVIGAHTGGFNYNSFAVSAMGTFSSSAPPPAMLNSIAAVLGWKLGLHGRNIYGRDVLVSSGGGTSRYAAGTPVSLNVVSGHRDPGLTECPGGALYAQLGNLRAIASDYRNANAFRDEDLYGALTDSTGSGRVEIHGLRSSSSFNDRIVAAATRWADGNPGQWRFFVGSSQGDTRPDLIGIRAYGTNSRRAEVHVSRWASNYQTAFGVATPMGMFRPDQQFQIAVGGPSGGDVYFIPLQGTGSGTLEVHALSASSHYTQWSVHSTTALGAGYSGSQNQFFVARGSADLYLVQHGSSGSGRSELHALSAASGYRHFTEHTALPMGYTDRASAHWAIGSASQPDLFFVPTVRTGSGRVELHRLSPGDHYTSWTQHIATQFPQADYPVWQFSLG